MSVITEYQAACTPILTVEDYSSAYEMISYAGELSVRERDALLRWLKGSYLSLHWEYVKR